MKYHNSITANKYKEVIEQLSKKNIYIIIKQDKRRGVVILDRTKYSGKCFSILTTKQISKSDYDPTSKLENKVQRILRKIKLELPGRVYEMLYPT